MLGDKTLFPNHEEVEMSWRVIDPLEAYWESTKPEKYAGGTWGPAKADEMLAIDGRSWRRP
jgi:glucose-6-phosphate 1-dehydrogenase